MRNTASIFLALGLTALIFSGCNKPVTESNSTNVKVANVANVTNTSNPANTTAVKKVYQDMPATIMNADIKLVDGKTIKLSEQKGKIVLVNLWAIWCGPCRQEMPELVKIQEEYKDKGVMVLGLDVDPEPETAVKNFVEKQQLNYTVGWSPEDATQEFLNISKMGGIPQSFLLSPDGKLANVFKGYNPMKTPDDVRKSIEEILSQPS